MLASDIARKIKDTMEYPGQIKVTVIRQLVAHSTTDEFSNGKNKEKEVISESQEENFSEN
jgi:hypothetical protein